MPLRATCILQYSKLAEDCSASGCRPPHNIMATPMISLPCLAAITQCMVAARQRPYTARHLLGTAWSLLPTSLAVPRPYECLAIPRGISLPCLTHAFSPLMEPAPLMTERVAPNRRTLRAAACRLSGHGRRARRQSWWASPRRSPCHAGSSLGGEDSQKWHHEQDGRIQTKVENRIEAEAHSS
jgi:hypothetical protein